MGVLTFRFKSNFLDLLKCLNNIHWFIVFFSLINISVCIYEDQIGKFDWRQSYVGRIKFAQFDTVSTAKKIIVATEENVLAALHLKTGEVVWRHVFENSPSGNIELLHVGEKVLTVSGSNPYLVRGWDQATGVLIWEWSLTLNSENAAYSEWLVHNNMLVHVLPVFGSHIEVTTYNFITGQHKGSTSKLPAVWTNEGCILSAPYYTCLSKSQLVISVDVTSDAVQIISKPLQDLIGPQSTDVLIRPFDGKSHEAGFIIDDKKIVLIKDGKYIVSDVELVDPLASVTVVDGPMHPLLMQSWHNDEEGFSLKAYNIETSKEVTELRSLDRALHIPEPEIAAVVCLKNQKDYVCRILVTGADDSVNLMQQGGRVIWKREESLANVVAAEFVELPVSDLDAAIELEFDQKEGSIWGAFTRRIHTQMQQLHTFVQSWLNREGDTDDTAELLVRDYFNLHKIIVLVTDVGKIFGMDNLSGEILWTRYDGDLDANNLLIFTRRTARHPPLDACVTLVGKHVDTGNGLLISINPINGALVEERVLHLDTPVAQAALLHKANEERLHAIILLDKNENVQVFPRTAANLIENFYMYVADAETAKVQGYHFKYDGQWVIAQRTWSVQLGGGSPGHRIVAAVGKRSERAQSPGRVMPDRSVLYKYLNPNLVLFLTEGPEEPNKDSVVATCLDAVSGAVIASQSHRRSRATRHAIHADNFMAYAVYNDKHRRTEIATIELYEGKQRWSDGSVPFSSLVGALSPSVERQSYIAPPITAAAVTTTQRALTDKHLLLALTSGALVEMPWAFLEPRRPIAPTAEQREEGLIPYTPELPMPTEAVINYNQTLVRVRNIYTSPAGLESTCLVLATGLDLFYTRVSPSKTFDLLKDDFDYYLITIVLAGLIAATYSTKYFASGKMLKNSWK